MSVTKIFLGIAIAMTSNQVYVSAYNTTKCVNLLACLHNTPLVTPPNPSLKNKTKSVINRKRADDECKTMNDKVKCMDDIGDACPREFYGFDTFENAVRRIQYYGLDSANKILNTTSANACKLEISKKRTKEQNDKVRLCFDHQTCVQTMNKFRDVENSNFDRKTNTTSQLKTYCQKLQTFSSKCLSNPKYKAMPCPASVYDFLNYEEYKFTFENKAYEIFGSECNIFPT
eukprot:Pgem_evm1s5994